MNVVEFFQKSKNKIETQLGRWGHFVFNYAWYIIVISSILLGLSFTVIPELKIVASAEDYLHDDDETNQFYNKFRDQFGRDERIILVIETPQVFDQKFLRKLQDFHYDIEKNVPKLQDVRSLVNARNTVGRGDDFVVEGLLDEFPETYQQLAKVKKTAFNNPLFKNNYFSEDGKFAAVLIITDAYSTLNEDGTLTETDAGDDEAFSGFSDDDIFHETGFGVEETENDALLSSDEISFDGTGFEDTENLFGDDTDTDIDIDIDNIDNFFNDEEDASESMDDFASGNATSGDEFDDANSDGGFDDFDDDEEFGGTGSFDENEFDFSDSNGSGEIEDSFEDDPDFSEISAAGKSPDEPAYITTEENIIIIDALEEIVKRHEGPGFKVHVAGSPPATVKTSSIIKTDMALFTVLCMLSIAILLTVLFRRVVMVVLPLTVALLATLSTLALMAFSGIPLTIAGQIIPSFILAVGVGNSVHLFSSFFQSLNTGVGKKESLANAMEHSGLAIIMTGLTTAGGLMSFISAELKPISDFGIITPAGIIFTLLLSLVLLPALITVFPMKVVEMKERNKGWSNRFLLYCAKLSTEHTNKVIAIWFAIVAVCLWGAISRLHFSHNPIEWFPEDAPVRIANNIVNEHFDGGMTLEVLVDTGKENGIKNPELLRRLDRIADYAKTLELGGRPIRQSASIADVSKEIHKALNGNQPEFYVIPDDKTLLAQELLLFENSGSDALESFVDTQFSIARLTIKIPFSDALFFRPFNAKFEPTAREIMGDMAELHFTGVKAVAGRIFGGLMESMAWSYILAILIITPLMIFLIGSVRFGLVSMIPNLAPIIITLGVMGYMGLPIDAFTLLIGSIALGLAVDDTIHFMHNYQRFYQRYGDNNKAVEETLTTTGEALFFTSLVLTAGFAVYGFSSMNNLKNFGFLTGFCVSLAFLADILLAPALVSALTRSTLLGIAGQEKIKNNKFDLKNLSLEVINDQLIRKKLKVVIKELFEGGYEEMIKSEFKEEFQDLVQEEIKNTIKQHIKTIVAEELQSDINEETREDIEESIQELVTEIVRKTIKEKLQGQLNIEVKVT